MSTSQRTAERFKVNTDTGFGVNPENQGGRFINKDGSYNVRKRGDGLLIRTSLYYNLLMMPIWKFALFIFGSFIAANLFFTLIYLIPGKQQFVGIIAHTPVHYFIELFFFSSQTFTTVGYGRINPVGLFADAVASFEAFTGLLSFTVVTSLVYGRFSRPRAYIRFSDEALISPYKDIKGLMFRFVSYKEKHTLTNVEVIVTLGMTIMEDGKEAFKFYRLDLERERIDSFPMNWTVVHPIDENSPLKDCNADDLKIADAEVYVLVRAFDDVFANTVLQRTSYRFNEIVFDAKFEKMYYEDAETTIVELDKLNAYKGMNITYMEAKKN